MSHIFISYKSQQRDYAFAVRDQLQAWGYETWLDVDRLQPGTYWADDIDAALKSCRALVGIMTPMAMQSRYVTNEWDMAIMQSKLFLPLLHEITEPHYKYIDIQYIDFTKDKAQGFKQLRLRLEEQFVDKPAAPAITSDPYADYLQQLFERVNRVLAQKIIRRSTDDDAPEPIQLRSDVTEGAVHAQFEKREQIDPLFVSMGLADTPETEFNNFAVAFQHFDGQLLLLGAPGAGKSITLLHHTRDAIVARKQDPSQPLPILANIATWNADKQTPIADWLTESYGAPPGAKTLIESGKALLLLDGLDELGAERNDGQPKQRYDPRLRFVEALAKVVNNQILVTSRVTDYEAIDQKVPLKGAVTLRPLIQTQIEDYLREQPHLLTVIREDERLREIVETPLLLSLFAFAYQEMSEDEREQFKQMQYAGDVRDKIFEAYIRRRYEHEANRLKLRGESMPFTLEQIYDVLGHVAMEDLNSYRAEKNILVHSYFEEVVNENSLASFTNWMVHLDILLLGERTSIDEFDLATRWLEHQDHEDSWRFIHLLVRDHVAYIYCLSNLRNKSFYGGTGDGPALALGRIQDTRALNVLLELIESTDREFRLGAIRALGHLSDARAVTHLTPLLLDKDKSIKTRAAVALQKIGTPEALVAVKEAAIRGLIPEDLQFWHWD